MLRTLNLCARAAKLAASECVYVSKVAINCSREGCLDASNFLLCGSVNIEDGLVAELLPLQPVLSDVLKELAQRRRAVRGAHHVLHCVVLADATELG
eukprot:6191312-Pleurochrysis_carterae.AAC.1